MSANPESITWYPIATQPTERTRALVHCHNNYYQIGIWDSESQRFWDKDQQPIVAGIEWSYRPDRDE
jgi:hypothetical protein